MLCLVAQLCPVLCNAIDCSPPGSSVHGIFQARTLEWIAISFSRRSSQPGDQTGVYHIVGRSFTPWATKEAPEKHPEALFIELNSYSYLKIQVKILS